MATQQLIRKRGVTFVGLKGTMNALYLDDLADKTRRGLRGRIEAGKSRGGLCYGYRVVRVLEGQPPGAREIDPEQAAMAIRIDNRKRSLLVGIASMPVIRAQYRQVWTRAEFLEALREIENEFRATGMLPLVQVETHGSIGGIGVSDQEGITFAELMEEFIPLNRMSGLHLIVVLAACEGIWGMKMLQPARGAAPFDPIHVVTVTPTTTRRHLETHRRLWRPNRYS